MGYIHGLQKDLKIITRWAEDLTDYTGVLHFRKDTEAISAESTVTAVVSVVSSIQTDVYYTLSAASTILPAGDYNLIIDAEVTSSSLSRRCTPEIVHINATGQYPYSQT